MITVKVQGLENLLKSMTGKLPTVRVGVLGESTRTPGGQGKVNTSGLTNAEVGAFHEFGIGRMNRSFLRVPITNMIQTYMEKQGFLDPDTLMHFIQSGSLVPYLKLLGAVAEQIVSDAFATGGFGKWAQSDFTHKKVHQTLVETQQLRDSITSEVVE